MAKDSGLTEVDFEIALTALVATAVASFPTGRVPEYPVVKALAVGLLALTLIRRLAVVNTLNKDGYVLELTTHFLDLFSYISILYIFYNISIRIAGISLIPFSSQSIFLIITPIVALGLLCIQQFALNDALGGHEELFVEKANEHSGEFLGLALVELAVFVGKRRQLFHNESRQSRLVEYYPEYLMRGATSPQQKKIFNVVVVVVLTSLILIFSLGTLMFDISVFIALILLISVMLTIGLVDVWYSLYGVIGAGGRNGNIHFIVMAVTYLFVGNMVFMG